MQSVLYILARVAQIALGFAEVAMLLRAILSWFIMDDENPFMGFLYAVTEPFCLPARAVCDKFEVFDEIPIDAPFFITMLALSLLNTFLPVLVY